MDDLVWNDSGSYYDDNSYEDSLYLSDDLSGCSSPPSQELHMVARMLGVPEIVTSAPEMRAVELALDPKFLYEGEKSWPAGANSGGVLFGEVEKGKGIAPNDGFWDTIQNKKRKRQNPIIGRQSSSSSSSRSVNKIDHFQHSTTSSLSFSSNDLSESSPDRRASLEMKELIYYASLFTPVNRDQETEETKRRRNVETSKEPQAKQPRKSIRDRIKILRTLVPGGSKMDTLSILEETISYVKFLQAQKRALEGLRYNFGTSFNPNLFLPNPFLPNPYYRF